MRCLRGVYGVCARARARPRARARERAWVCGCVDACVHVCTISSMVAMAPYTMWRDSSVGPRRTTSRSSAASTILWGNIWNIFIAPRDLRSIGSGVCIIRVKTAQLHVLHLQPVHVPCCQRASFECGDARAYVCHGSVCGVVRLLVKALIRV